MASESAHNALRALAHPLRVRLLMELRDGPATAAMLAERTAQTRGNASYHLRALARDGLIQEDPGRGTLRERWWRVIALPEIEVVSLPDAADAAAAAEAVGQERARRLSRFAQRLSTGEVSADRGAAARVSELRLGLPAARQAELVAQLDAVLARWEQLAEDPARETNVADDGEVVEVQLAVFSVPQDD